MEILNYSAKERNRLKTFEWNSRANVVMGHRAIKMLRPICKDCQNPPEHPANWYETCPHFGADRNKMYWSYSTKIIKTPVYEEDEDGDLVVKEEQVKTKLVLVPNWTEVPADTAHSDGQAPRRCYEQKGFRYPEEIGLAPMCQFSGCGKAWPRIRTSLGDYCTELHAKLAVANELEINLVAHNPRIRAQQLREISL
jgi:hypothetical protein